MKFGKLLSTAMEDIHEDLTAAPVVETPEEAAASTAAVNDSYVEVDSAMEAIDEAVENAETLDTVADNLGKIEAAGGMDENMAAVAQVAIEGLYKKLAVKRQPLLAMETYQSPKTRKNATALALENIQETAKKVWQAILNMLKQAYEFVKNFFKAIFDKNAKIANAAKAKLEALKKFRADNNVDDSIIDGKIENEALAVVLNIDGKVDFSTIKDGFECLDVFLKAAKETTDGLKKHLEVMHEFFWKITEKELGDNFSMPGLDKFGWRKLTDNHFVFDGKEKVGFGNHHLEIDSGNVQGGKDSGDTSSDILTVKLFSLKQDSDTKSLSVLSLDEIQRTLELIINGCSGIEKSKSVIGELESIQESLEKETDSLLKTIDKLEKPINTTNLRIAKKAITVVSKLSIQINTVVSKHAISSSGHVLQYVDLCMKEHKIVTETPVSA